MVPPAGWAPATGGATGASTIPDDQEEEATADADGGGSINDNLDAGADSNPPAAPATNGQDVPAAAPAASGSGRASDGMERGTIAGAPSVLPTAAGSISSRIKAFYARYAEADEAVRVVEAVDPNHSTFFDTEALQKLLRFIVTCGGSGLSVADQRALGAVLLALEPDVRPGGDVNSLNDRMQTPHSLVTAVRREEDRVLAARNWMCAPMEIGEKVYSFFYRDMLLSVIDALKEARNVQLEGAPLEPDEHGEPRRSHTLNSDLYLEEQTDVRRIHGRGARTVGVMLHMDEAVVAWNGNTYVYPIRVLVVNIRGGEGAWMTIGYVPHIPKVVGNGKNARARLAVADNRRDMQQRCLAVVLRRFAAASEHGASIDLPRHGAVFIVPRVVGLVVDQVGERSMLGLMGAQSTFNCTPCLARRLESCDYEGVDTLPRPVVSTLIQQLHAAESRVGGGRPHVRDMLGASTSALPFVPALGAVHGLSTGAASLYRIVSFDTLHVWKLGVLRLMAQRLPLMLQAVCGGTLAVRGSVQNTLDAVNLRGFELGRLCRASPASPGYVNQCRPPSAGFYAGVRCEVLGRGRVVRSAVEPLLIISASAYSVGLHLGRLLDPQLLCSGRGKTDNHEGSSVAPFLRGMAPHGGRSLWTCSVELRPALFRYPDAALDVC